MSSEKNEGRLAPCPSSPNCVSTLAVDAKHKISPLQFVDDLEKARVRLIQIIESFPRAEIIQSEGSYLHATFQSRLFRFVDDVEFLFDEGGKKVDFRSASRVGYSDLGANRRRMEEIRKRFQYPAPPFGPAK